MKNFEFGLDRFAGQRLHEETCGIVDGLVGHSSSLDHRSTTISNDKKKRKKTRKCFGKFNLKLQEFPQE